MPPRWFGTTVAEYSLVEAAEGGHGVKVKVKVTEQCRGCKIKAYKVKCTGQSLTKCSRYT